MDNISLFARHSFATCVSKGYAFLAKQLLLVSKVMLPYFTIASLLCVLSIAYNVKLNVAVVAQGMVSIEEVLSAMLLHTLAWLAAVVVTARMFLLFRRLTTVEIPKPEDVTATKVAAWKRSLIRTMQLAWRSLPYTIWVLILNMPGFPIVDPCMKFIGGLTMEYKTLVVCGLLLLAVIAVVLLSPFIYTFYCRMMKPTVIDKGEVEKMRAFGFLAAYKKGFKHKGKIIMVTLWSLFLLLIACAVILLPGIVATEAYLSSVEGSINFGDKALIPAWGYALVFTSGTIAMTFCCLLGVAFSASLMYLFGDIYSKEK